MEGMATEKQKLHEARAQMKLLKQYLKDRQLWRKQGYLPPKPLHLPA